ncbi:MAG: ABC transporter substrate-binding protein [candidate division WOR-3 bacterium]
MKYVLYILNIILAALLVFIIVYPQFKASQIQEMQIVACPDFSSFPIFVAKEKGYFDESKVKVLIEYTFSREDPVEELRKGKFEVLAGYPLVNFLYEGIADVEKFRLVGMVVEEKDNPFTGIVIKTKEKKLSFKLFEDKIIAVPSWRKDAEILKKWLTLNKVKINEGKIIRYSTSVPYGEWEVAYLIEPSISFLKDSNNIQIFTEGFLNEIASPYPYAGYFVSQTGLYFKREAIIRFKKIYEKAVDFINNPQNREEVERLLERYEKEVMNYKEFIKVNLPLYLKKEQIQDIPVMKLYKWLKDNEMIFQDVDISSIFASVP